MVRNLLVLVRLACALACTVAAHPAGAQVNVPTHHNDNGRSGANLKETILTPANVNATQFGKLYNVPLDSQVFAQPLYISGVPIAGLGMRNVVYVATMKNSVYALDADNNGQQLWVANFGAPVHPCDVEWHQNVTQGSTIGILSTPVIDVASDTIYFVSRNEGNYDPTKCNWKPKSVSTGVNQGVFTHYLNALDIRTGAPKFGSPMLISASYSSSDGATVFQPGLQNQRAALALANGHIYIAYASHDDLGPYHGWVLSYSATTLALEHSYADTTTGSRGGIWQGGNGLPVDSNGFVYASTGNGDFGASKSGVTQTGNSWIKLSPTLTLLDYFTPSNSATLNSQDADLGSSGLMVIPGTAYLFGGGKQGVAYVVNSNNMGHFNAAADQVKQEFQAIFGNGTQHIHGTPIYFNSQSAGPILYVWGENDYLRAYAFNASTKLLTTKPIAMSTMTAPMTHNNAAMPGGFLSVSANGASNGIIWASTPYSGDAAQATVQGVLHAFDAVTLKELWNDKLNDARDEVGNFAKFVPPTVANGKVFLPNFGPLNAADGSGSLNVYGLLNTGTAPATPLIADGIYEIVCRHSNMVVDDTAKSRTAGTVQEQWTSNDGANQQWKVTNLSPNVVSIINQASNMALDVDGGSTADSALVVQNPYTGARSQQWTVSAVGSGFVEIQNLNSGKALDVYGGVMTAGAKLDQYPYKAAAWQQWSVR
jgi:Ricin-type beta-trefoil lectin domain-like/PQQ enzyme repeat